MEKLTEHRSSFKTILSLCAVVFIDYFALTLSFPLLAPLFSLSMENGGLALGNSSVELRNFLYGITMAIYSIFMFFSSPLLGHFADQIGRRKTLLFCLSGSAISAFLSGTAVLMHSFILLFLARIVAGCMAGSVPSAQAAIIDISTTEKEKTIHLSLIAMAMSLGYVLGPVVGGVVSNQSLVSWFGFQTPFFLAGVLSLCNIVSLSLTFKEPKHYKNENLTNTWMHLVDPLIKFWKAFFDKSIRNVMLCAFFFILGWNIYLQYMMLYLFQEYHFTSARLGNFVSWIAFIMSITMLFIIRILVRYFTTRKILHLAIILCLIGVLGSFITHTALTQWTSATIIASGIGLGYATIMKLFSDSVPADMQGWIMGVSASCIAAGSALAGILTGFLSIHSVLAFTSILVIFFLCLFYSYQKNYK